MNNKTELRFSLDALKRGLESNIEKHPENKHIHIFTRHDFKDRSKISTFTPEEEKRGYKKVVFGMDEVHADPCLILNNTIKNKQTVLIFTGNQWRIIYSMNKDINIISSKISKSILKSDGCVEYSISVLQHFDGSFLKKMRNGKLEEVDFKDIKNRDLFITKQQLKLRQSCYLLRKFGIKSKYNEDKKAKNEVLVKDSQGRPMTIDEYNDKYMVEMEHDGVILFHNKLLNMLTVTSYNNDCSYIIPHCDSQENLALFEKELQNITNITAGKYSMEFFPYSTADNLIKTFREMQNKMIENKDETAKAEAVQEAESLNPKSGKQSKGQALLNAIMHILPCVHKASPKSMGVLQSEGQSIDFIER